KTEPQRNQPGAFQPFQRWIWAGTRPTMLSFSHGSNFPTTWPSICQAHSDLRSSAARKSWLSDDGDLSALPHPNFLPWCRKNPVPSDMYHTPKTPMAHQLVKANAPPEQEL